MTPKQFAKFLERDGGCLHCGESEAVSPNHRANRGMGGSKVRDVPSNVIVLCSEMNHLIEHSAHHAAAARSKGWKLWTWQDPLTTPVFDTQKNQWFMLDDNFDRKVINSKGNE